MKTSRLVVIVTLALAAGLVLGCTQGNHSADNVANVVLSADIRQGPADIDISSPTDVAIGQLNINSKAKAPNAVLSAQQDVKLTEWVVTCTRTDGGSVASPQWHNFYTVFVPAGGSANLQNFRIFPSDYYKEAPLSQLFPENGGLDKETGKRTIRQHLQIDVYGKTVSGDNVVLSFSVNLNFFYVTP
jgi:hypothetical protein